MDGRRDGQTAEIECRDVFKTFRMGEVDVQVLKGINLEIFQGQFTVILGPSGSGKSTLMNLIGGLDRPTSGSVIFGGRDLSALSDRELTEHRRANVGFVFQFYNLVPSLTALENVEVSSEIVDDPLSPEEALALVDLTEFKDHFPAQLSGGQQQRVSIARALAKKPRLLLCDEPTGALDLKTGQKVLHLLTRLNEELGTTLVIITHASPIAELAHRVVLLTSEGLSIRENETRREVEEISW